jgi:hypothetical protein
MTIAYGKQEGDFYRIVDTKGNTVSSRRGILLGYTSSTYTVHDSGDYGHTYDESGKTLSSFRV